MTCTFLFTHLCTICLQDLSSSQKSGGNLLQMLYDKPSRWSYTFQVAASQPANKQQVQLSQLDSLVSFYLSVCTELRVSQQSSHTTPRSIGKAAAGREPCAVLRTLSLLRQVRSRETNSHSLGRWTHPAFCAITQLWFQVRVCFKLVWVWRPDRDWVERLSGLAHLDPEPVWNRHRPRRHHLPESWSTGTNAKASLFVVSNAAGFGPNKRKTEPIYWCWLQAWFSCVFSSAACSVCVTGVGRRSSGFLWNIWSSFIANMNLGSTTGRAGNPTKHACNDTMICLIMSRGAFRV